MSSVECWDGKEGEEMCERGKHGKCMWNQFNHEAWSAPCAEGAQAHQ